MDTVTKPRWLVHGVTRPEATRLFCFPHGGGSVAEYIRWTRDLATVEAAGIQLPGRGARQREPALTSMPELVDAVADGVDFAAPCAFFGHSLGSLVAYEVVREIRRRGGRLPMHLVVSGFPGPHLHRTTTPLHTLPDDELLDAVARRHAGIPAGVLEDSELRAMAADCLRSDYRILETYRWEPGAPLDLPVTVFAGRDDEIDDDALDGWRRHTTGPVRIRRFPGGHFYLRDRPGVVMRAVARAVAVAEPPKSSC